MQIIYLTYDSLVSSVFDSQVSVLLQYVTTTGLQTNLVSFERKVNAPHIRRKRELIDRYLTGKVILLKKPPFLGRLSLEVLVRPLSKALQELIIEEEVLTLHCRGYIASYIAIRAQQLLPRYHLKILADMRGVPEEILFYTNTPKRKLVRSFRYREAKRIEKAIYTHSDSFCCVSHAFKNYITQEFEIAPNRVSVIPCAVDTSIFHFDRKIREQVRHDLGLRNKLVFTYCGSMALWQLPEKMVETFEIAKSLCPNSHLLVLTKNTGTARRLINKRFKDDENFTILSLSHEEVARYLMAGDIGLLLRKNDLVNRVAFPTKFAEYMACGMFVLTTSGVEDIAAFIRRNEDVGYVLEHFPQIDENEVSNLLGQVQDEEDLSDLKRKARFVLAKDRFSVYANFWRYEELYGFLANT